MAAKKLTVVSYVYKKNENGERVPMRVDSLSNEDRERLSEWLTESLAKATNEYLSQHPERIDQLIKQGAILMKRTLKIKGAIVVVSQTALED